jgi:hypothetical protein
MEERNLPRGRFVNPCFAEWLHGLPLGWTDCTQPVEKDHAPEVPVAESIAGASLSASQLQYAVAG